MTDKERKSRQDDLIAALSALIGLLRGCSADELADLVEGRLKLQLSTRPSGPVATKASKKSFEFLKELASELRLLKTRDDGMRLIDRQDFRKTDLEKLARILDLPVQREDTVERLREKIIEASIGFRLRSEAVRGSSNLR